MPEGIEEGPGEHGDERGEANSQSYTRYAAAAVRADVPTSDLLVTCCTDEAALVLGHAFLAEVCVACRTAAHGFPRGMAEAAQMGYCADWSPLRRRSELNRVKINPEMPNRISSAISASASQCHQREAVAVIVITPFSMVYRDPRK